MSRGSAGFFGSCLGGLLVGVLIVGIPGCSKDGAVDSTEDDLITTPTDGDELVLEAVFVENPPLVDGNGTDAIWGQTTPVTVTLDGSHGHGGGVGTFDLSLSACYYVPPQADTIPVASHWDTLATVYFLVTWPDSAADLIQDKIVYNGGGATTDPLRWGTPADIDDDGVAFMFENVLATGGQDLRTHGCLYACHRDMRPLDGSVDMWHWSSVRTGYVGGTALPYYADDQYANQGQARTGDEGDPCYLSNVDRGIEREMLPLRIAGGDNGGLDVAYAIWELTAVVFDETQTINPMTGVEWRPYDYVPGYRTQTPSGGRADVEAGGRWEASTWAVEFSRDLVTESFEHDKHLGIYVSLETGEKSLHPFAVAVFGGCGKNHSGSTEVIYLTFVVPPEYEPGAGGL